ncbi:unnamed protein product [Leptosia nina]|uniref:Uncharacterized protein n=1 Tax=Leptosia nina TaxID=320188 RepID=A0AAV1JHN4_9NEOP
MDYLIFIFLSLAFRLSHTYNTNNNYYFENHKYCDDLSPYYGEIDLDQISGIWYGVEKLPHVKGEYRVEHTNECFYVDIKELYIQPTPPTPYPPLTNSPYMNRAFGIPEQYRIRHFVLEWHEGLWQDDYHIKVNTSHKGFWPTDVPNGSVDKMYRFFGGVIQVLKVSHNHLVLNFCMRLPHSQMYSVVLARNENQLTPEDLASIHNIFSMKNLSTSTEDALSHILCDIVSDIMFAPLLPIYLSIGLVQGLCGDAIRWSHRVNIEDVYGVWYGVGYAQHNPDMTSEPNAVGCVTLYISDADDLFNYNDNFLDATRSNYTDSKWRSSKSNPWSSNALAGSWLDIRLNKRSKRDLFGQKRIRVLWDEDGHSMEQIYLFYPEEPGFWTAETMTSWELEMKSKGVEVWYPDDPPRHPDVIRLLKVTPYTLILNHCSEIGDGGIFSLILRRSPSRVESYRYGDSTRYPPYSTPASGYNQNQFPYKNTYVSDIAPFPEGTRYPNYSPGYSTNRPNYNSAGSGNVFLTGYNGARGDYGKNYQGYGFDKNYGPVSSYERPFFQYNNEYCQNRSPQNGIWIDSLTGMWFGVEYIQHLGGDSRIDFGRTCIVIHISEPNDRNFYISLWRYSASP